MKHWGVGLAFLVSACMVNGKAFGPGSSSSSGGNNNSSSSSSSSGGGGGETSKPYNSNDGLEPYLTAPADPWLAVNGDQPVRWPEEKAEHWKVRSDTYACNAKADHCVQKQSWFIVRDKDVARYMPASASWTVFEKEGIAVAWNGRGITMSKEEKDYTAFRTVPATKTNIKVGSAVIALSRDNGLPDSEVSSYNSTWHYGFVEEVDVEGGFFTLKNKADTYKLAMARVIVLSWKPGGKVEIVGGRGKTDLAVKASDVFMPE